MVAIRRQATGLPTSSPLLQAANVGLLSSHANPRFAPFPIPRSQQLWHQRHGSKSATLGLIYLTQALESDQG